MSKPFDEVGFRQRLIDEGTSPDQAFDIARKMADDRQQQAKEARIEAQEEGVLRLGRGLARRP